MKNELLRLENISYAVEGNGLLNNISIRIFENEILCVLGLNNSGKSFLANYIAGSLNANSGKAFYDGTPIIPANQLSEINSNIFLINVHTAAPENITFSEYLYILSGKQAAFFYNKKAASRIARDLLHDMNIDLDPEREISSYSIGKQHILMILGAYFSHKKLVILDCIGDSYPPSDKQLLKYTLEQIKKNGTSILLFTRKYDIAKVFGERTALMKKGRIVKLLDCLEDYDKHTIYSSLSVKNDYNLSCRHTVKQHSAIQITNIIPSFQIHTRQSEIIGIIDNTNSIIRNITRLLDESRLDPPIKGYIENKSFVFSTIREAYTQKIGIIFDPYRDSAAFDNLSIQDNLTILKMDKLRCKYSRLFSSKHQKILLQDFILSSSSDTPCSFSDLLQPGFYTSRKIALKKWLIFQPAILICINPFAHLDFENKVLFSEILDQIAQKGTCILIISDDISTINPIFNKAIFVNNNKITSHDISEGEDSLIVNSSVEF